MTDKKKTDKPKTKVATKPKPKKKPAQQTVLTPRQRMFADYFIETGHQRNSAVKAGYSEKAARQTSSKLIKMPLIKEYIAERMAQKDKEVIASQDEILSFLSQVMRGEVKDQIPLLDGDGYQKLVHLDEAATKDRIKAAELLGKRHALWTEKKEIEGDLSINIAVDYGDDE